jgi:ubiquinone/menaquinone biosynthesis C-methylase UbiE
VILEAGIASDGPRTPDFGRLAATYDLLRPVDENWRELLELLVREGDLVAKRVLDIGCGTGRLAAALHERGGRVWGVDPSPEMVEEARSRGVNAKVARAEQLPFKEGWFERAVLWLTVHLLDRPRAFAELHRVLGLDGRVVIATFDPSHFDRFWLNEIFPSLERIDRERFPAEDELTQELLAAGFEPRVSRLSQRAEITREAALERIRGRYISTLELLSEEEYQAGLERAERELPNDIGYALEWLIVGAVRS